MLKNGYSYTNELITIGRLSMYPFDKLSDRKTN